MHKTALTDRELTVVGVWYFGNQTLFGKAFGFRQVEVSKWNTGEKELPENVRRYLLEHRCEVVNSILERSEHSRLKRAQIKFLLETPVLISPQEYSSKIYQTKII